MTPLDPQYRIHHPEKIFSPGLVVFEEIVDQNIKTMLTMAGSVDRLRPHCKTHKMPAVIRKLLACGVTRHKAATFAEAEMLATTGVGDIFLAYNIVGPNLERVVEFRRRFPDVQFAVTGDDAGQLKLLSSAVSALNSDVDVVLDINPGRDRTGCPVGQTAFELYQTIDRSPGLNPGGLHLYDGHLRQSNPEERRAAVHKFWESIAAFRDRLETAGLPVPRIVCGGTPTFPIYSAMDDPSIELSPGTCIFHDFGYGDAFPDLNCFSQAAAVLTRVISRPTANRVTLDVGTKAIASDPPMGKRVVIQGLNQAEQVLQNEEHLVIEAENAGEFQVGDWLLAFPRHVCPTSALYRSATVISQGEIVDHWEVVARDRQLTI